MAAQSNLGTVFAVTTNTELYVRVDMQSGAFISFYSGHSNPTKNIT